MSGKVYLDYNATTPLEPEVLTAIHDSLKSAWGNPSSSHEQGVLAKEIINTARENVAAMIGAKSKDVIFTSGGTEANNMVIHTAIKHFWNKIDSSGRNKAVKDKLNLKPHIITSNIEHDSICLVLKQLEKENVIDVTYVAVSKQTGFVNPDDVVSNLRRETCLVTIMTANNETGIVQPVREICGKVKGQVRDPDDCTVLLHTDAAQALGKIPVNVEQLGVDYLTIVGQKFYGPRIGALFVKDIGDVNPLHPMFYGGGQERSYRPGTENTGMIAGLGKACELICQNLESYHDHMLSIRTYLESSLKDAFQDRIHFNGRNSLSQRLPNTCNISILGKHCEGHQILKNCEHIQASVGAACHNGRNMVSSILLASGVPEDIAVNAIRLSVGRQTSRSDVDVAVKDLIATVQLLSSSP